MLVGVERGHDVGVNQTGRSLHLALEAEDRAGVFQGLPSDKLEGHNALHTAVLSLHDLAHAALTKSFQDQVFAERKELELALEKADRLIFGELASADQLGCQGLGVFGTLFRRKTVVQFAYLVGRQNAADGHTLKELFE